MAIPVVTDDPLADPGVRASLEAARAARRLERSIAGRRDRLAAQMPGVVTAFHRLLALLEARGYLHGWSLTEAGERLRIIYNELDLLLAEAITGGLFAGSNGPETAALGFRLHL